MTKPRKTRYNGRLTTPVTQHAYRGHLIIENQFNEYVSIQKGGFHLSYAKSIESAKQTIDQIAH